MRELSEVLEEYLQERDRQNGDYYDNRYLKWIKLLKGLTNENNWLDICNSVYTGFVWFLRFPYLP